MTGRLAEFSKNMPEGMDAVLITSPHNRRYYLNFSSSAGAVVVTREQSYFIIDSRYYEAARDSVKGCEILLQGKLYEQISGLLGRHGTKTLGVEGDCTCVSEFFRLQEKLYGIEVVPGGVSEVIAKQRSVKDAGEIESIQKSQDITDQTFSHILNFIKSGVTEREIALEMEWFARRLGALRPSFDFIVAAGKNSSKPHAVPTDNPVRDGDFVVLDFGVVYADYCSDMTRTVGVGAVGDKQRAVYNIVLKAQLAGLSAVKAGERCQAVDGAARGVIDASAYRGLCGHGIGHSLGLEVHEPPSFNQKSEEVLKAGVVMSVEPGIYIPGEFGVRIEDLVAVTESGCRNLTGSAKELIIL